jgi:leucyl/phenylalanyl-tRNA---protein transferase
MTTISPQVLLQAYCAGIFPMAETAEDNALYWVEPDERGIIPLHGLHISRSLRKQVRKQPFEIRIDTAFADVMAACAAKTETRKATWINQRIRTLYIQLHKMGCCHSVECWRGNKLVGGLYGVKIGAAFFGESMFSRATNASKIALVHLVARLNAGGFELLDAQFMNPHLETLGAMPVSKAEYQKLLAPALEGSGDFKLFSEDNDPARVLHFAGLPPNPSFRRKPESFGGHGE